MVLVTQQKLENLNYSVNKFIIKIRQSKLTSQDAGDGLQSSHYHCIEINWSAEQFGYILREIGNQVRGCQWTWKPLSRM